MKIYLIRHLNETYVFCNRELAEAQAKEFDPFDLKGIAIHEIEMHTEVVPFEPYGAFKTLEGIVINKRSANDTPESLLATGKTIDQVIERLAKKNHNDLWLRLRTGSNTTDSPGEVMSLEANG